nr:MAG: hypothetical protein [Microvirus Sku218]
MAVKDLISQPEFVKADYSSGDKAAAVFGNDWGMQQKQNAANFQNQLNMINYANDVNRQNMVDAPSLKKQGLINAGVNPLAAAGSIGNAQLAGSGNQSPSGELGSSTDVFNLMDRYVNNVTKILRAINPIRDGE